MIDFLDKEEDALLAHLADTIDIHMARLSNAQQGVKVSTGIFNNAWRLILRSKGLDPANYRVRRVSGRLEIEEVVPVG